MTRNGYIHGTDPDEQARLALLNGLTNKAFVEFLELKPDDRVLEVGSGLGILAGEVAQHVSKGRVVGVEYAPEQLAAVRGHRMNLTFLRGDAHYLPFESNAFDVVYCRYVLEHLADLPRVLNEIRRVLKPGGRVYSQECNILVSVLYPDCPMFDKVWGRFAELQAILGGDALIGKKLFWYFKESGFNDIELSVQPEIHQPKLRTFKPWIENLIGNVRSGAEELERRGLATHAEIDGAIAELNDFMTNENASAYFYWNRIKALKKPLKQAAPGKQNRG